MTYETAYEKALEQVQSIKSLIDGDQTVTVCGRDFQVREAKGCPKSCQIWCHRDGINGLVCVGAAVVQNCRSFQNARERVAEKIARELIK